MQPVVDFIDRSLCVMDLGSFMDASLELPDALRRSITLVRLDANDPGVDDATYRELIPVRQVVADQPGRRCFTRRILPNCSSLLDPDPALVDAYDLHRYFEVDEVVEVETTTLPRVMDEHGIKRCDVLKTDLEGMDFAVVQSLGDRVRECALVVMEVRFQPFYLGEPPIQTTLHYMADQGFDLLALHPEIWKYNTRHRDATMRGRTVMANATFVRRPARIREEFPDSADQRLVRQVIGLWLLDYRNYAEHLLETELRHLPEVIRQELVEGMFPPGQCSSDQVLLPDFPHVGRLD